MGSFRPPDHIVNHEVGHALVMHATGVGVASVRVGFLGRFGECTPRNAAGPRTRRRVAFAGPIAQKLYSPTSILNPRLSDSLFDPCKSQDRVWCSRLREIITPVEVGWGCDLREYCDEICNGTDADLPALLSIYARAENDVTIFLSTDPVKTAARALFAALLERTTLPGDEVDRLLNQHPAVAGLGPYAD